MANLLRTLNAERSRQRDSRSSYVDRLLRVFPTAIARDDATPMKREVHGSSFSAQPLVEPLSERELEVLRLLAAGHDNAAIARELVVAVSTVKAHVNHIFGKLGVGSRLEAALRARQLNLL